MAFSYSEKLCLSAFCLFVTLVNISSGCSPIPGDGVDKIEKKFYYSDLVVYGKVLDHFEEDKPMYDSVYTALMEVYCTFKGDPVPQRINVSEAGSVPGLCHSTNLTTGHEYTVFLNYDSTNKKYTPTFKEDNVNDQYLEEISLVCEHNINYPTGLTEDTAKMTCPENYPDYDACLQYVEPEPEDTSNNDINKAVVDNGVEVKPLTEGPPIVAPASNGDGAEPSIKDGDGNGNGSDVVRVSCILYLGLIIYALAL